MGQNGSTINDGSQFAAIREVRAYWDALRDDQDLPRRDQINPRGMAGALHQVFMVERIAPGVARFRVAGLEVNDLMGMDLRGMPLSALFDPAARATLAELVETVVTARTIVELDLEADRGIGRPALRARLVLLPLQGGVGEVDLLLGCLVCEGKIGRTPRRFVIARAVEQVLDGAAPLRRDLASPLDGTKTAFAPRAALSLVTELAEPAAQAYAVAAPQRDRQASQRPYLRLVQMED